MVDWLICQLVKLFAQSTNPSFDYLTNSLIFNCAVTLSEAKGLKP